MADTTDIGTLLNASDIQHILQVAGSPFSYDPQRSSSYDRYSREFHLHFYTGRVPTQAEHFYGLYVDRVGDTLTVATIPLSDRYLGRLSFATGYHINGVYPMSSILRASGVVFPQDKEARATLEGSYKRIPAPPYAKLSWMLDWTFSAGNGVTLQREDPTSNWLWRMNDLGYLPEEGRPTWFCLTPTDQGPHMDGTEIEVENDRNRTVAHVYRVAEHYIRSPILMGTVGELGSGADLEFTKHTMFSTGSHSIELTSLRVIADNFISSSN